VVRVAMRIDAGRLAQDAEFVLGDDLTAQPLLQLTRLRERPWPALFGLARRPGRV
jgi:hypothetical protein